MARRDEEGYYYLVDRKKNMIITGGENVYPSEVENVVGSHQAVKDVAVIGIPDDKWGEKVAAVVITARRRFEPGQDLAKEILDYCRGKIAGFKRPKQIDFIDDSEMPRTGTGKILHRALRGTIRQSGATNNSRSGPSNSISNEFKGNNSYAEQGLHTVQRILEFAVLSLAGQPAKRTRHPTGRGLGRQTPGTREISPDALDGLFLGMTIGQPAWFYGAPWFAALMGNDKISGPIISQACATSASALALAGMSVEAGAHQAILMAAVDRCSNGPHTIWPNPKGPGGEVISENWLMDNFNRDPYGREAMIKTAENVSKEYGITKEESDACAVRRYEQYTDALADDRAFQKEYMIRWK